MYERSDDDNQIMSAIYGDQASVAPPQPTQTAAQAYQLPTHQTAAPTTQTAAQPGNPNAPAQSGAIGADMFAGIYGGGQPQPTPSPAPQPAQDQLKGGVTQTGAQGGDDRIASYRTAVSSISSASSPQQRAQAQDSLARSLYADMQQAGHDVQWDGDVMVIDGRRYTVGTGTGTATGTTSNQPAPGGPPDIGGSVSPEEARRREEEDRARWDAMSPEQQRAELAARGTVYHPPGSEGIVEEGAPPPAGAPAGVVGTGGATEGFDPSKYGKNDPKYVFQRIASQYDTRDPAQREAMLQALRADPSGFFANATLNGDILTHGSNDPIYNGIAAFDIQRDTENGGPWQWAPVGGGQGAQPGAMPGALPPTGIDAGLPAGQPGQHTAVAPPGAAPDWSPTAPTYTPGDITFDDIPTYTQAGLAEQMGGYTPTPYTAGEMGVNAQTEADQEALIQALLQHPESLDATAVERLKVGNREEQADLERADMDELTALGAEYGIDTAPWMASQRIARRGQTSEGVARGNRAVDMEAAETNMADRRAAAGVGSAHLAEVGSRHRGEESLRQGAAKLNEDNAFNAASLRADNVARSAKLALDAATEKGDRMALRESVNQAAAELGISADKLTLDYVTSVRADLTDRYGIDVDAALKREGMDIDWATLRQRGSEFQQELAFKLQELAQRYEVDMSGIGLGYSTLQQRGIEHSDDMTARSQGW
jgi:hypothetical protein